MSITVSALCRNCQQKGSLVSATTLINMLKPALLSVLCIAEQYFFCTNEHCSVAYFAPAIDSYFAKEDLKVTIGLKETEPFRTICYCFQITVHDIQQEITTSGETTIPAKIKAAVQANSCACEIKNPAGHCCLGEVNRLIKCVQQNGNKRSIAIGLLPNSCC